MFRHVALFTWTESATAAQVSEFADELGKLPETIGEIRSFQFGPNAGVTPGTADFALVADFDDVDGYLIYRDHPAHREFIAGFLTPLLAHRCAVQYSF